MKKRSFSVFILLLAVCFLFVQTAFATESRLPGGLPTLFFRGNTAVCQGDYQGTSAADNICVTITLYNGNTYIASWSASGTGRVKASGECAVEYGKTYRLEMSCSVNGVQQPVQSATETCRKT